MDQRLWAFECYATSFTNALVCGAFDKLVKANKCVDIFIPVFFTQLVVVFCVLHDLTLFDIGM